MLWLEENVGKLEEQCSFLGFDRDGSDIVAMPDIGSVQQVDGGEKVEHLSDAQIVAVEEYHGCLRCKARVESQMYPFGRCETMQRFDECTEVVSAVVMYRKASGSSSLHAFGDLVRQLANVPRDAAVKEADLMMAPRQVRYKSSTKMIVAVRR